MKITILIGVILASVLFWMAAPVNAQTASALPTRPVSINMQGGDVRTVLDALFRGSGINYSIDPGVTGTVTVNLRDVPFDVALRTVLRDANLTYSVQDGIYNIKPRNASSGGQAASVTPPMTQQLTTTTQAVRIPLMYIDAAQLMQDALGGGTVIPPLNMRTSSGGMGGSVGGGIAQ